MRSRLLTFLLLALAGTGVALAVAHFTNQDLSGLFGKPPRPVGESLMPYNPQDIDEITIDSSGRSRHYERKLAQWILSSSTTPDRANYRALTVLAEFPATLIVMNSYEANEEERTKCGLNPPVATLHYEGKNAEKVGSLLIGKRSAWHKFIPDPDPKPGQLPQNTNWPCLHIALADQPNRVYVCASPLVDEVLNNGFESHRDLHPFFFPPQMLARVTIRRPTGTLVLERKTAAANWAITSPLQLDTNPDNIARMVAGLFQLAALKVEDKPAPPAPESDLSISLNYFGLDGSIHETTTTLAIDPPLSTESDTVTARLDDWRKNILFTLPLKGSNGRPGLNDIPLTLDQLRGANLTSLPLLRLQSLTFESPELAGPMTAFIEKSPISGEWRARKTYQGKTTGANELVFFEVKKTLAEHKILNVASDTNADEAQFGLNQPDLTLTIKLIDGRSEVLRFGSIVNDEGLPRYFLSRQDSSSIVEVSPETFHNLSPHPYQWRPAHVWNFNLVDLTFLEIQKEGTPKFSMRYNDLTQIWSEARINNADVTHKLIEHRANRLLENLQDLTATRWLGSDHPPARLALQNPYLSVTAIFRQPDDIDATLFQRTLKLAPLVRNSSNRFYYGQISEDPDYFLVDLAQINKIAVNLLDE